MAAFEIVSCLVCSCFQLPPYGKLQWVHNIRLNI